MVYIKHCCYGKCNSDSRYADSPHMVGVRFLNFPKPKQRLEKCLRWIRACGRPHEQFNVNKVHKMTFICTKHFVGGEGPTDNHPDPIPARYCQEQVHKFSRKRKSQAWCDNPASQSKRSADNDAVSSMNADLGDNSSVKAGDPGDMDDGVHYDGDDGETVNENISVRGETVWAEHSYSHQPRFVDKAYEILQRHPDWVPSFPLGHTEVTAAHTERYNRGTTRQQALTGNNTAPAAPQDVPGERSEMDEINQLLEENRVLNEELLQMKMDEHFFKGDDAKVRYYTGLPSFAVMMGLLMQLLPCLPQTGQKLSPFQMLLLTLMRLRLNISIQHIVYFFSIDQKTVSTVFRDTIGALFTHLSPLVHWPERHCLEGSMPHQFVEAFGNHVAVIVDCFEIKIERASSLKARVQVFSHYKYTIKYLIGITLQGAISFISKGWGGRASDKHVTENSGLLDKLLPGDLVLADHGFDIRGSVGLMCAEVKIPAFTRGRCRLDAKNVEETRRMAHLRVHVERVIRCVRTRYTILSETIPVSTVLPCEGDDIIFLDKIVSVCCALTNMCPSAVVKPSS
ncbi:uncharacterized protein LOC130127078 isoform X2 [Lampris incognitus]|uniref:uncharacterized protein LOC130127078 isoform X2 n=1 Tax=Lampris incognitus TaxID=2546036 RepID=UPI0024B5E973|nr:uncharacterized protein LOC130127078 isoform X2 [Lampris incognitus]